MRLLDPVARLCAGAGVPMATGRFQPRVAASPPVLALTCAAEDNSWDAVVTAVRGQRRESPSGRAGTGYRRDPETGYDLDSAGELVYEVQIHENSDGLGGHGRRPIVVFRLFDQAQSAADEIILWSRRVALFTTRPPIEDPAIRSRRERRRSDHRRAAAAHPSVRIGDVPGELAADAAAIDPSVLCFHFPRARTGRYLRSAVVALAGDPAVRPHLRSRWLTARADADGLTVGTDELIPANQPHRWDATPWLWRRDHAGAEPALRWQVERAADAAPIVAALRRGEWRAAFAASGVAVDPDLTRILDGVPHRTYAAELTATWVANMYAGISELAPWRLADAHRSWRDERARHALAARDPVVLFGLGGLGTARKPKVALDAVATGPVLRLVYTGGNAVLPHPWWTVPADLAVQLTGLAARQA
jgi:hypothetical protein